MASFGTEISKLPSASPLTGTEYIPIVQNGQTRKTTVDALTLTQYYTPSFVVLNSSGQLPNERILTTSGSGITLVDQGAGLSAVIKLNGNIENLQNFSSNGFIVQASGDFSAREFQTSGGGLAISNGDGISGNPVISVDGVLSSLVNQSGTGIIRRTGTATVGLTEIEGTSNQIDVANGDAQSGNPTVSISSNAQFPGTGGNILSSGTAAQRLEEEGRLRYNTDTNLYEYFDGSIWISLDGSGSGGAVWGYITGTLSNQTDLQAALDTLVPYTGATQDLNLGNFDLYVEDVFSTGSISTNGSFQCSSIISAVNSNMIINFDPPSLLAPDGSGFSVLGWDSEKVTLGDEYNALAGQTRYWNTATEQYYTFGARPDGEGLYTDSNLTVAQSVYTSYINAATGADFSGDVTFTGTPTFTASIAAESFYRSGPSGNTGMFPDNTDGEEKIIFMLGDNQEAGRFQWTNSDLLEADFIVSGTIYGGNLAITNGFLDLGYGCTISADSDQNIVWNAPGSIQFNGSIIADIGWNILPSGDAGFNGTVTVGYLTALNKISAAASSTSRASLNIPSGTAPSSPVDGDMWYDGTNLKSRVSTNTKTVAFTDSNITGSAAKWTTARNLAGNSVDGSANVAFANKFIVQGTADSGLSAAQFLGSLGTGIVKNTTTTGVLSIAVAGDFPTLNQNTTGSAATLTTPRAIYGNNFDGSAALTQVIASTYGGTGNGFTKFSGPATTEKTFTLPNASATILTDNAVVTVAQGGTGRNTSTTAYGLIAAGTTATGAHQTLAAGATTEILVGGGASALPVWTTATGSGSPVRATSPTLTTPKATTTIGVGDATPSASGSGISFPAAQDASTDANTLDDYEEGTWTPVLDFVTVGNLSVVYSTQVGQYTKIGNVCHISAVVITSTFTHTTASGNNRITGLPFTSTSTSGLVSSLQCCWQGITKANYTDVAPRVSASVTTVAFSISGSGQNIADITTAECASGTQQTRRISGHYFTA